MPSESEAAAALAEAARTAFDFGWTLGTLACAFPEQEGATLRCYFRKLISLQGILFPEESTQGTWYAPGQADLTKIASPTPEKDAATIETFDFAELGLPAPLSLKLVNFGLCDACRRGFNLWVFLKSGVDAGAVLGDAHSSAKSIVAERILGVGRTAVDPPDDALQAVAGNEAGVPTEISRVSAAKRALSEVLQRWLGKWNEFAEENLYTGGLVKNDDTELEAYKLGYGLACLAFTAPEAWKSSFHSEVINRLQHRLGSITLALDCASPGAGSEGYDPARPLYVLRAVRETLEMWERAVKRGTPDGTTWGPAIQEQATIWRNLVMGDQSLSSFSLTNSSRKLASALKTTIDNEVLESLENELKPIVQGLLEKGRFFKHPYWVAVALLVVVALILLGISALVFQEGPGVYQAVGVVAGGYVAVLLSWIAQGTSRVEQFFAQTFDAIGKTLSTSTGNVLAAGTKQLKIDAEALGYRVGLAYPLLEVFLVGASGKESWPPVLEVMGFTEDSAQLLKSLKVEG